MTWCKVDDTHNTVVVGMGRNAPKAMPKSRRFVNVIGTTLVRWPQVFKWLCTQSCHQAKSWNLHVPCCFRFHRISLPRLLNSFLPSTPVLPSTASFLPSTTSFLPSTTSFLPSATSFPPPTTQFLPSIDHLISPTYHSVSSVHRPLNFFHRCNPQIPPQGHILVRNRSGLLWAPKPNTGIREYIK